MFFLLICDYSCGQNLISEEKAIKIAIDHGLEKGLNKPQAVLQGDSIWEVKILLCEEYGHEIYHVFKISALAGELIETEMGVFREVIGRQLETTQINFPCDFESIPKINPNNKRYRLTSLTLGDERNPAISSNNKHIAFQFGFRNIGLADINGKHFRKICDECFHPYWIDNKWLTYIKDQNQIYKLNIDTQEEIKITTRPINYNSFQISPDFKWIAYTSGEIWQSPEKDSQGRNIFNAFMNGQGQELCLASVNGENRKFITKTGKYVHSPCWSKTSDSILFYIENEKFVATGLENDTILYSPLHKLERIALRDYKKSVSGKFPFKSNCKIYSIDINSLQPDKILIEEPGRYYDLHFSKDLNYLIYSKKEYNDCEYKLWILSLDKNAL